MKGSNTGTVSLAPGDYAVAVRLFCMSHARPARSPLAFVLGPMRGKRAPAIIAMNSRASSTPYQFSPIQQTSWTIQGGLGYTDFPTQARGVVDTLIPDYKGLLGTSTLDDIQGKWSSLSSSIGGPSLDSILGQLGGAGQLVIELRDERSQIISEAGNFDAMRRTFAPIQPADVSTLDSPWAVISPDLVDAAGDARPLRRRRHAADPQRRDRNRNRTADLFDRVRALHARSSRRKAARTRARSR